MKKHSVNNPNRIKFFPLRTVIFILLLITGFNLYATTLSATYRGNYTEDGFSNGNDGNAITGQSLKTCPPTQCNKRYNAFFVFDLSAIDAEISSVSLNIAGQVYWPYTLLDHPTFSYVIRDVSTSVADLINTHGGSYIPYAPEIFDDLNSGSYYGSASAPEGETYFSDLIEFSSQAVIDINQSLGDYFAIGISTPGMPLYGTASGTYLKFHSFSPTLELEFTPVTQEISNFNSLYLLGIGLLGWIAGIVSHGKSKTFALTQY